MNTPLHDLMHRAVEDTAPDLDQISTAARSRGLAIRRRRQALSVVGAVLAVAVIAVGTQQLFGAPSPGGVPAGRPTATPAHREQRSPAPEPVHKVPMTGRMVAAALWAALHQPNSGSAGDNYRGQASDHEAYAELRFRPMDFGGYSLVGINVQPGFAEKGIYRCRQWQVGCRVVHPYPDATLMTYEEHTPTPKGTGIRRVADLLRADGVRVVVSSSNGRELAGNAWDITRDKPPLSYTQLYLVVSEPWWGPTMDSRWADVSLSDYTELDSDIAGWDHGTPSPSP